MVEILDWEFSHFNLVLIGFWILSRKGIWLKVDFWNNLYEKVLFCFEFSSEYFPDVILGVFKIAYLI